MIPPKDGQSASGSFIYSESGQHRKAPPMVAKESDNCVASQLGNPFTEAPSRLWPLPRQAARNLGGYSSIPQTRSHTAVL